MKLIRIREYIEKKPNVDIKELKGAYPNISIEQINEVLNERK